MQTKEFFGWLCKSQHDATFCLFLIRNLFFLWDKNLSHSQSLIKNTYFLVRKVCFINNYSYFCSTRTRQASQRCSNVRVVFVFSIRATMPVRMSRPWIKRHMELLQTTSHHPHFFVIPVWQKVKPQIFEATFLDKSLLVSK